MQDAPLISAPPGGSSLFIPCQALANLKAVFFFWLIFGWSKPKTFYALSSVIGS